MIENLRFALLSYWLWSRHIFYDIIGRKPKKGHSTNG